MDLVTFLLSRIAEDEQAARAVPMPHTVQGTAVEHYSRYSPPRVLLEAKTKRRMIEALQGDLMDQDMDGALFLRWMALPYEDHADFQERWSRP